MRKAIGPHWKASRGSAMLEEIAMTERYRVWVDEVAGLFGGLEVSERHVGLVFFWFGSLYPFASITQVKMEIHAVSRLNMDKGVSSA